MMLAYIGQGLLGATLFLAGLQAIGCSRYLTLRSLAYGQLLLVAISFLILIYAHSTDQFSLLSVQLHSHTQKPLLYKISGTWGNHEGSMLLWILILLGYTANVAYQVKEANSPYSSILPVMGFINFAFLLFILMACDPFALAQTVPLDGQDLNPLLQDPSLAIHPPILYMGYAGFVVPYAFAISALIHGEISETWIALLRPWILIAWTFLTLGVGLGSFWAYYELGWGGWWFWDPVENAALMPWLTATALLHTIISLKTTRTLPAWTIFLCILTFALCLFGTFLVRSGLLISVHNFAVDPERGLFMLSLSSLLILPAFCLFIRQFKLIHSLTQTSMWSRSGLILFMSVILIVGAATIALGTVYPLFMEAFNRTISVGPPYFYRTFVPMMLPLLVLVGLGPWYSWTSNGLSLSSIRWLLPIFCLTIVASLIMFFGMGLRHIIGLSAFMGSIWIICATAGLAIKKRKIISGTIFAHLGVGVAVLGMVGSSLGEQEVIKALAIGDTLSIGPISLTLQKVMTHPKSNYTAQRAYLLDQSGNLLTPEKRFYWTQGIIHGESAIRSVGPGNLNHVYVTLGQEYENQKWSIHAYYKPYINLLWVGVLMMVFGGLIAIMKRWGALTKMFPLLLLLFQESTYSIDAHEQLVDPGLEQRARLLCQQIICPTCQGQSLDESPVESATQLRTQVRKALIEGQSDQQILESMASRFGDNVLTMPPVTRLTYLLWFGPWSILIMVFGIYFIRRRLCKNEPPQNVDVS